MAGNTEESDHVSLLIEIAREYESRPGPPIQKSRAWLKVFMHPQVKEIIAESIHPEVKEEPENESWLVKIATENALESNGTERPMQRVPLPLRQVKTNETCFDPKVVSLGPYHRPKPMDYLKKDAVRWFFNLSPDIYKDFKNDSASTNFKDKYVADQTIEKLNDDDFQVMMFVDGCFILYFIHLFMKNRTEFVTKTHLHHPIIFSDMLLLENQIPYAVLKSLMTLMPDPKPLTNEDIKKFIEKYPTEHGYLTSVRSSYQVPGLGCMRFSTAIGRETNHQPSRSNSEREPLHLVDILWTMRIGDPGKVKDSFDVDDPYYFRSITELKAAGIRLCKSKSSNLRDIVFKEDPIHGFLSLPQMIINDGTKTQLLNLIAYEMCPGFPSDSLRKITSYVCFLDALIDHPGDVKELRSKGILRNRLGSDEQVAKLFNEVGNNLMPDPRVYGDTMSKIQKHVSEEKCKVRIAEFVRTYCSSPWSAISLICSILFLYILVLLQTIFTIIK